MKKVKLSELGEIVGGSTPAIKDIENYDGNISWITPKDLANYNKIFIVSGERSITEKGLKSSSTKMLPKNSVLFTSRAPIGYIAIAEKELCTNQGFKSIIPNNNVNYIFLYYLLKYNKEYIASFGSGTTFKEVSGTVMKNIEVNIPDTIEEQKKIANILYSIDKKIELNNQINNNLEELMKTFYQRWFIEFEFPNEEGKPYKSSGGKFVYNDELKQEIPEWWKVKKAKELTDVITGKEDANFSTDNGKYKFFTCSNDTLKCDIPAYNGSAILIAGNGDFNVKHYTGCFNAYQRTYVLIPENINYYSAMYISAKNKIDTFKKRSSGSIVKFITKGMIEDINVIIPNDKKLLEELNKILFAIEKNNTENDKLTDLKNFLLPLLMNGQINVDDIEI